MATWILEHAGTGPGAESFESCGGEAICFHIKEGFFLKSSFNGING